MSRITTLVDLPAGDIAHALKGARKGQQPARSASLEGSPGPSREHRVGMGTSSTAGSSDSAASTSKPTYQGTIQGFLDEHSQPTLQHSGTSSSLDTGFVSGAQQKLSARACLAA